MGNLGIRRFCRKKQRSMALGRVPLVAKQRARLLGRQLAHPLCLDHCFRQCELAGVDPLQIFMPACPRRRAKATSCALGTCCARSRRGMK